MAGGWQPKADYYDTSLCVDVRTGSYYEKAVLWAVEAGVTDGLGPDLFVPDATCTHAQIVISLYRTLR